MNFSNFYPPSPIGWILKGKKAAPFRSTHLTEIVRPDSPTSSNNSLKWVPPAGTTRRQTWSPTAKPWKACWLVMRYLLRFYAWFPGIIYLELLNITRLMCSLSSVWTRIILPLPWCPSPCCLCYDDLEDRIKMDLFIWVWECSLDVHVQYVMCIHVVCVWCPCRVPVLIFNPFKCVCTTQCTLEVEIQFSIALIDFLNKSFQVSKIRSSYLFFYLYQEIDGYFVDVQK